MKRNFFHASYNFPEVGSICKGKPKTVLGRRPIFINSRKIIQPKDRSMPSIFLCMEGKPKLRVTHLIKHMTGTRQRQSLALGLVIKDFMKEIFYFCLSVEKYYQNHSLRTLLNTKLKSTHSYAELPLACLLKNEVVFLYPNNPKTIELNDEAFFL